MIVSPSLSDITRESFKIGCLGFGGPAGQVALMHRIYVEERKWVDEETFQHGLNYCTLLPGPEAQQLATYLGWKWQGVSGGVISGLLFVLPGALVLFALAWLYVTLGQAPAIEALFFGIKAAVVALIAEALWKIGKRALKTRSDLAIAVAAFIALYLFNLPFPLIILTAAIIGLLRSRNETSSPPAAGATPRRNLLPTVLIWTLLWLAPVAASFALAGPDHVITKTGMLFSKLAVVTFGGAYAMLAYLQQEAVTAQGWLTQAQMLDGFGLAETTPGPLVLVNQFVGFLAGWQAPGGTLGLAALTAAMASWCTFAPSFVWIFAGAPFADRLRQNGFVRGALAAISSAVLGIIAKLAAVFAAAVLFRSHHAAILPWGTKLQLPDLMQTDFLACAIALASALALIRFKVSVLWVVPGAALLGLLKLTAIAM